MNVPQTRLARPLRSFRNLGWLFTIIPLCLAFSPTLFILYYGGITAHIVVVVVSVASAALGASYLYLFGNPNGSHLSSVRLNSITVWAFVSAAFIAVQALLGLILEDDAIDPITAATINVIASVVFTVAGVRVRANLQRLSAKLPRDPAAT